MNDKKGQLVIVSGPSGSGKDVVVAGLLKIFPNSVKFVTTTSRPPRGNEKEGVNYWYINREEFEEKIKREEFLEHNLYADNYYGSERKKLAEALTQNDFVFAILDINGRNNFLKNSIPHLSVFILPESMDILRAHIERRGGVTPEKMAERLKTAEKELAEAPNYDFQVKNKEGKLEETIAKTAEWLEKII